jgi:hypothetical protein
MFKPAAVLAVLRNACVLVGCGPVFSAVPGAPGDDSPEPVAPSMPTSSGTVTKDSGNDAGLEASPPEAAQACVTDLSNIGAGDFHIAFTLTTSETGKQLALVSQRAGCDETSAYWSVTLSQGGGIVAVTSDGTPTGRFFVEAGNSVNDGIPHRVLVSRVNGQLSLSRDGIIDSMLTADPTAFDTLPALAVGTDTCSTDTALEGNGSITDLCITQGVK